MAISDVRTIMGRIKVAEPHSPILVMRGSGSLHAYFADTVESRNIIDSQHPDIIGVFHRNMCPVLTETVLKEAV